MITPDKKLETLQTLEKEISSGKSKASEKLLFPYLDDPDMPVRLEATRILYRIDKEESLKLFKSLCRDKNPFVRLKSAFMLGKIETAESLSILLGMVYDTDIDVRKGVMKTLIAVKNKGNIHSQAFNEKLRHLLDEIRKRDKWILE